MACSNPCRRCRGGPGKNRRQNPSPGAARAGGQTAQRIPVKRYPHPIPAARPEECRQLMELLYRQEYLLEEIRALLVEKVTACEQIENKC